uniref:DDE-type integrase/transposase/recombinase n=1 Tax=Streptomyces kebangsaanensis TaxID=864058 RepID=UPI00389AE832
MFDILVPPRRDTQAARRFLRRLLKDLEYMPWVMVAGRLRSHGTAHRQVMPGVEHRTSKHLDNRAENPHRTTRRRERATKRFTSPGHAQRFLPAFNGIPPHFRPRPHRLAAAQYRTGTNQRFTVRRQATGATVAARQRRPARASHHPDESSAPPDPTT